MVSPSKKKRKVTTTKIKAATSKEKKAVLTSSVTSTITSPNRPGRQSRSSLSPSFKSKTAATSHPSSSKTHPPLSNTSFFSSIRSYSKDGADVTSELSKNTLNDFDLKHNKKIVIRWGDDLSDLLKHVMMPIVLHRLKTTLTALLQTLSYHPIDDVFLKTSWFYTRTQRSLCSFL